MRATRRLTERARRLSEGFARSADLDGLRAQTGHLQALALRDVAPGDLRAAEFRVFSQFGEDGIIQHLLRHVAIEHDVFVEFGVEDYRESNTRFLLVNDNWRGLILDGGTAHVDFLERSGLRWRHEIDAVSAFVDRGNIDELIAGAGVQGDIGLLSIDLDGNDLWVLERIEAVTPRILVVEYNATFGPEASVAVPYDPGFRRALAHSSGLYWGASLPALEAVARRRGYTLVGGNSAGNNAFFVRDDVLGQLPAMPAAQAWAPSRFRESRDEQGRLTYIGAGEDRLRAIRDAPLWDLATERQVTVGERFGV